MKKNILVLVSFYFILCCFLQAEDTKKPADYVNPFIGTGGHGHTYPGVTVPFGMVQLSPDTRLTGWDGCSAYYYSDTIIYGFSHTHFSGTGCSDLADILLMPSLNNNEFENNKYSSSFRKINEKSEVGYYTVLLDKYNIKVELTATKRTGFHKYTFPKTNSKSSQANILIDLQHRDKVLDSKIEILNDSTVVGYRRSSAWAADQHVYFAVVFSQKINKSIIAVNNKPQDGIKTASGVNIKAYFSFNLNNSENIILSKVGISGVSIEGALSNLKTEATGLTFDEALKKSKDEWNTELSKIKIESSNEDQKATFYTALYHTLIVPNLWSDCDGSYRGRDNKIHKTNNFDYYTCFSLWDTYRAEHPLFTIIQQKRTNDFINTFLREYEEGGLLPVWEFSSNETFCMIGYHSVPVIVDAYMKGIRNYDINLAFKAIMHSADTNLFGLDSYKKYQYVRGDDENASVSKTLEYAYDDWCISQMAKSMNKQNEYYKFIQRAQSYKNLFDNKTGFMRSRVNGSWYEPFDPYEVNFNYTEANCWQYTFYVPHDIETLASMLGGKDELADKLDELFTASSKTTGIEQSDISGLIGQYAHGNEPSHQIAYMYDYAGKPWKTQRYVRKIMDDFYDNQPDGLIGNEDCGQMSAWFVMSAMGIYEVCPGSNEYAIGTPLFNKTTIKLENGNNFIIRADNVSHNNIYIQSAKLNGIDYNRSYIKHEDIMSGGELVFVMGSQPNKEWGKEAPHSKIKEFQSIPAPIFSTDGRILKNNKTIEISCLNPDAKIYYTTDGYDPDEKSNLYTQSLVFNDSMTLKAIAIDFNEKNNIEKSSIVTAKYSKMREGWSIKLLNKYGNLYTAGGPEGLIDNIRGTENFMAGGWQGYQEVDFEAILDLGKKQDVHKISSEYLQSIHQWIWLPVWVEYYVSDDGINFESVGRIYSDLKDNDYKPTIRELEAKVNTSCRYVKVHAKNYGKIPEWHAGAGFQAHIFIDEIIVD